MNLVIHIIIIWATDTDNDMGIKVGQYFAEGSNTNVKSSLHKKNVLKSQLKTFL